MSHEKKFIIYTSAIFICYFCFGILQEKVVRGPYEVDGKTEKFTFMFSLVFVQCFINYLFSKFLLFMMPKQLEDTTRTVYYGVCSLTYLLAMVCSNMALQFVSYPTQVIGKSAKPIPVMVMGVLLAHKSYPIRKYIFVLMVIIGVIGFIYKQPEHTTTNQAMSFGFGELLILLSLTMDGLTSTCQERMKHEHKTKAIAMMMNMNLWSLVYSMIVIMCTSEIWAFLAFLQRHPSCLYAILIFGITSSLGQYFIYATVTEFGPLPCSVVTTTRKFFTVLASVFFFGNTLLLRQWIAAIVVFAGLFLDVLYGKSPPKKEIVK